MKYTLSNIIGLFFLFLSSSQLVSQERCSFNQYIEFKGSSNPNWLSQVQQVQQTIEQFATNTSRSFNGEIAHIPVVVHILYNNEIQNISDQQVFDQIQVLNQDYRRLNSDTTLTRDIFKPVAADAGIEFYLAQTDPDGNPTNGITRTQTDQTSFWLSMTDMKSSLTGGKDAWPVGQYLNLWVCNMSIPIVNTPFILGFATPPNGAPNWPANSGAEQIQEDGVVIHYEVFGPHPDVTGTLATVNRGRTASHEIGHYLGLRHIWGDGDCTVDDGLTDTPNAAAANQQTCDYATNSCTDDVNDLPDMLENYMDYSDENCLNMFTQQQVAAMHFVIENFRSGLITQIDPYISSQPSSISVFPNPCVDEIHVDFKQKINQPFSFECFDLTGRPVLLPQKDFSKVFNTSELNSGQYLIRIKNESQIFTIRFVKK